jgi:hypothetical protein
VRDEYRTDYDPDILYCVAFAFAIALFFPEACVVDLFVGIFMEDCKILLYRSIINFVLSLISNDCTERRLWKVGTEGIRSTAAAGGI